MEPYQRLESELAPWCGMPHVAVCSSGTAALHLALEALRLPQGSEVIVPDFAMYACAAAVRMAGLVPVFVDCGPELNMNQLHIHNYKLLESKAILGVHTYGRQMDMDRLTRYACMQDWFVIEDMAELHGVHPCPQTDLACWSFYKNKIVAGEEGGCVASDNPELIDRVRQLRNLGFTEDHDFTHIPRGVNARLSNANAGLILDSLRAFQGEKACRRTIEGWYDSLCPSEWKQPPRQSPWVYDIRIPGMARDKQDRVVKALKDAGIQARHAFKPLSQQEEFRGCRLIRGDRHEAEIASREVIYLPIQPGTTTRESAEMAIRFLLSL